MNVFDIAILICIVPFLINGLRKGFVSQVAAIISLIAGVWLSFRFTGALCGWAGKYMDVSGRLLYVSVFTLIMIVVIMVFFLIGRLLRKVLRIAMLGWLDRLLGFVFALFTALLVISIPLVLFNTLNGSYHFVDESTFSTSKLYAPLKDFAYNIFPYFNQLSGK